MRKLFIVLLLVFGCAGSDGDSSTDKDTPEEIKDKKVPAEEVVIPAGTTGIAVNGVDAIKKRMGLCL